MEPEYLNICTESDKYLVISIKDETSVNFFSVDKSGLDSSITYIKGMKVLKYTDTIFFFIFPQKGIYYYNAINGQTNTIIEGENEFSLESIENNVLKYDNGKTLNL